MIEFKAVIELNFVFELKICFQTLNIFSNSEFVFGLI